MYFPIMEYRQADMLLMEIGRRACMFITRRYIRCTLIAGGPKGLNVLTEPFI